MPIQGKSVNVEHYFQIGLKKSVNRLIRFPVGNIFDCCWLTIGKKRVSVIPWT